MIEFLDMMHALFALRDAFPGDVETEIKDGVLTVRTYVGMENQDLWEQGKLLFAEVTE